MRFFINYASVESLGAKIKRQFTPQFIEITFLKEILTFMEEYIINQFLLTTSCQKKRMNTLIGFKGTSGGQKIGYFSASVL